MIKKFLGTTLLFLLISVSAYPQLAKSSWSFGFGATYPRLMSISSEATGAWSGVENYGVHLYLQRNFSEHVALRLLTNYSYMETEPLNSPLQSVDLFAADLDMLYYFVPCEAFTPYLIAGMGTILFGNHNSPEPFLDDSFLEYQFNLGLGAEWRISDTWSIKGEGVYHTSSTNRLDGYDNPGSDKGLFGGNADTYVTINLGVQYYFSKGEPSNICDIYDGLTVGAPFVDCPTIEEIEEVVKKYACEEVVKEVIVEKPVEVSQWVLVGVNFEFNSAELTEGSYPILYGAVQYLNQHKDLRIEIQGHTDNIGSDEYNQRLSERRAETVRNYLVAQGIDPNRLTTKGYGESVPIADNNTPEGRALNRRIEFKVIK